MSNVCTSPHTRSTSIGVQSSRPNRIVHCRLNTLSGVIDAWARSKISLALSAISCVDFCTASLAKLARKRTFRQSAVNTTRCRLAPLLRGSVQSGIEWQRTTDEQDEQGDKATMALLNGDTLTVTVNVSAI